MIVSGVKHACATCIRGHRSSSCKHADRQLYEIRKKGRPVSQCMHCRDLRKMKSCHTRCECGENAAEQAKSSNCKCHSGQPCSCAGPVQIYQYVPPELSNNSSVTTSTTDGVKTPIDQMAPMLHTFSSIPNQVAATPPTSAQIKSQRVSPYAAAYALREADHDNYRELLQRKSNSPGLDLQHGMASPHMSSQHQIQPQEQLYPMTAPTPSQFYQLDQVDTRFWPEVPLESVPSRQLGSLPESSSISKTMRSIGTNTEPLPPGVWPENLFLLPNFNGNGNTYDQQRQQRQYMQHPMPRAEDKALYNPDTIEMHIQDMTNLDPDALTPATAPVPSYSTFYQPQHRTADASSSIANGNNIMSIDHYEDEFDPEYFDTLFDVPGCALPGVQCRCGDDCSCDGCRTHRDNNDKVAMQDLQRLDFSDSPKINHHPAGCCDTRSIHAQHSAKPSSPCCGTKT